MDLKKTISRSFSRKLQISQYEPVEVFASYTEEVPAETDTEEIERVSAFLYDMAKSDVEMDVRKLLNEKSKAEAVKRIDQGGWPKEE